jgi:2-oxoglutarate dehydrogenase complex dehydrogenase (E1) component-like enzyme
MKPLLCASSNSIFKLDRLERRSQFWPRIQVDLVQEEPRNMGAWTYIAPLLAGRLDSRSLRRKAGRPSPAVGSKAWHDQQQKELVHQAFTL